MARLFIRLQVLLVMFQAGRVPILSYHAIPDCSSSIGALMASSVQPEPVCVHHLCLLVEKHIDFMAQRTCSRSYREVGGNEWHEGKWELLLCWCCGCCYANLRVLAYSCVQRVIMLECVWIIIITRNQIYRRELLWHRCTGYCMPRNQ